MPGSNWNGTLSFGLVAVPVVMLGATRELDVRFHQVDAATGERVRIRRVCQIDGAEVDWEEIGHGYEIDGRLVMLSDEELAAAAPERTHTIEIEEFVELDAIDPAQLARSYHLLPGSRSEGNLRAYDLLCQTMAGSGRAAIGRMVLRSSEHLVCVRERDGLLSLTTLRFADELRAVPEIESVPAGSTRKPKPAEVAQAVKLIEALTKDFVPDAYEDRDRTRLLELVASKRTSAARPNRERSSTEHAPVPDLMAALKASLERSKRGR